MRAQKMNVHPPGLNMKEIQQFVSLKRWKQFYSLQIPQIYNIL